MGGATSISGLGLYYVADPTGEGHNKSFIFKTLNSYQVLEYQKNNLFLVVAECIYKEDALALLEMYH